jgi:hypothetical protein
VRDERRDDVANRRYLGSRDCAGRLSANEPARRERKVHLRSLDPAMATRASSASAAPAILSCESTSTMLPTIETMRRRSLTSTGTWDEIHPRSPLRERSSRAAWGIDVARRRNYRISAVCQQLIRGKGEDGTDLENQLAGRRILSTRLEQAGEELVGLTTAVDLPVLQYHCWRQYHVITSRGGRMRRT